MKYTFLIEASDNGYAAYLPDLPGCVAAGDTIEETRDLIREAAIYHLEMLRNEGLSIPEARSIADSVAV